MQIEFLDGPQADTIAREDASDGEFFERDDGSVWYRNTLLPGEERFVNSNRSDFVQAVAALHRYNVDVTATAIEQEQMFFVRRLELDLSALGFLHGPAESFWPSIVEQAGDGMM